MTRISGNPGPSPVGKKDWTVLYYLNGNNDLQPQLVKNLLDAEKIGSNDRVDIVAQLARAPKSKVLGPKAAKTPKLDGDWTGMRRYHVQTGSGRSTIKSKPVQVEAETPNHGEAATLSDFLRWGMENYPAKRYMVVIGDHGKGFQGTGFDYQHKDILDLGELKQAFETSGLKPDVLVMDACEMGAAEVAYQLKDQAGYLVASEEIIGSEGLPHRSFMEFLTLNPKTSPKEVARALVQISSDDTLTRLDEERPEAAEQLAALDLSKMKTLGQAVRGLAGALEKSDLEPKQLRKLIRQTQRFSLDSNQKPDQDFRDLDHFCTVLREHAEVSGKHQSVSQAAAAVEDALKRVVVENHTSGESEIQDAQGLSVYLPTQPIRSQAPMKAPNGGGKFAQTDFSYQRSDFDQATGWSDWLARKLA